MRALAKRRHARKSVLKDAMNQPLNEWRRDLRLREPDDIPAGQKRFDVFGGVRDEPGGAIVAPTALDVDAALDLDQRPAFEMGEIGPPFSLRVKDELTPQLRSAEPAPVESEFRFESRAAGFGAEAGTDELHSRRSLSKRELRPSDYTSWRQPQHRIGNGIQKARLFEFLQALAQFHEVFQTRDLFLVVTAQEELPDFF